MWSFPRRAPRPRTASASADTRAGPGAVPAHSARPVASVGGGLRGRILGGARGVLLGGLMFTGGCDMLVSGEATDGKPTQNAAKTKAQKAAEAEALAKARAAERAEAAAKPEFVYNPIGKRDPFRTFLDLGTADDSDVPRTPLQRFEIDQYALVGIVWGIDRPRALVEDPEQVGHVMEVGTYIGKNWGKVTQITSGEVVVTEEYQTIGGELVVNTISMGLSDGDER